MPTALSPLGGLTCPHKKKTQKTVTDFGYALVPLDTIPREGESFGRLVQRCEKSRAHGSLRSKNSSCRGSSPATNGAKTSAVSQGRLGTEIQKEEHLERHGIAGLFTLKNCILQYTPLWIVSSDIIFAQQTLPTMILLSLPTKLQQNIQNHQELLTRIYMYSNIDMP